MIRTMLTMMRPLERTTKLMVKAIAKRDADGKDADADADGKDADVDGKDADVDGKDADGNDADSEGNRQQGC